MYKMSLLPYPAKENYSLFCLRLSIASLVSSGVEGWVSWNSASYSELQEIRRDKGFESTAEDDTPLEALTIERVYKPTQEKVDFTGVIEQKFADLIHALPFVPDPKLKDDLDIRSEPIQFVLSVDGKEAIASVLELTSTRLLIHIPRLEADVESARQVLRFLPMSDGSDEFEEGNYCDSSVGYSHRDNVFQRGDSVYQRAFAVVSTQFLKAFSWIQGNSRRD